MNKKVCIAALAAASLMLAACGEKETVVDNSWSLEYFNSWMQVNGYFDADNNPTSAVERVEPGIYVLEKKMGDGVSLSDASAHPFLTLSYTLRKLDGTISETTDEQTAKWLGTYSSSTTYGPRITSSVRRDEDGLYACIEAAVSLVNEGGEITFIAPGWLQTYSRYDDEEGYLSHVSGTDCIFTIKVGEAIPDKWEQKDSTLYFWEYEKVENFVKENYPGAELVDKKGLWYAQTTPAADAEEEFKSSEKIYFNYTGKLLSGKVFDTTIAEVAADADLSVSGRSPIYMNWNPDSYSSLTMGSSSSSVVTGFKQGMFKMRTGEKGVAIFHSCLGYAESGSGSAILPFTPILFELECLGKKE